MSVYLGNQRVSASHTIGTILNEGDEVINATQMAALNDAVNYRSGKFDTNTIPEMINELKQKYMVALDNEMEVNTESTETWTRPQDWPDLDSLNLEMSGNTDFIYMTFDADVANSGVCLSITGSNINVTIGHITSGTYVVDETITKGGNYYIKNFSALSGYIVMRITGTISNCVFVSTNGLSTGHIQYMGQTPLLERIAYVPNFTRLSTDTTRGNWGTMSLEREKIANGTGTALTRLDYSYANCLNLRELDLSGLHTPNVTQFNSMFFRCLNLYHPLDLRHFNVAKASTFSSMFSICRTSEINLTGWTTTALSGSGISYMFSGCYRLKHIYGIENFNTANCTSFASLFNDCYNLREVNLNNWNMGKATSLTYLFRNCHSLKNLNSISTWNISKITSLEQTFYNCWNIEKLDLHNWDVSLVTTLYCTFSYCLSLKQLNISGWNITRVTTISNCFSYCISLINIDLNEWHITNVCTNIYQLFYFCFSLQSLNIPNDWDLSGLNTGNYIASNVFYYCYSLKTITGISDWILPSGNTVSIFQNCYSLETVDVSNWDTSKSKSFASMFSGCYSLKNLDVSRWTTSLVTSFSSMFSNCRSLISLNLSNFDISNATTLANMFTNCYSLTTVGDISNWNVSNVTTLVEMFSYCLSLKSINLDNWDVRKVTTLNYLLRYNYNIESISLKNWKLNKCTTMSDAFIYCYNLKTLDLSGWETSALTTAPTALFRYCYNLKNCTGAPIPLNHSYAQCYNLSYESILAIYTNLPQVNTTRTITVDTYVNNQLTADEKAIATGKGWTISTTT